jgi:hypothetical protein
MSDAFTPDINNAKAFADYLRTQLNCGRIDYSDIIVRPDGVGQIRFNIHDKDNNKTHEVYLEHTGKYRIVKMEL